MTKKCIDCGTLVFEGPRCRPCGYRIVSLKMTGKHHGKGKIFSEEHRRHLSIAAKKRIYKKGYKLTEEQKKRYVNAGNSNRSPEKRKRLSEATQKHWNNPNSSLRIKTKEYWNESNRIKQRLIAKLLWENPEYRDKVTRQAMSNQHLRPNRQEVILNDILSSAFPNEWKYVGNGDLVIAGKCPDFVNVNGKKALIELFGDYWHKGENPEDRQKVFEPYGYSTLVIWEHELKTPDMVLQKINNVFYS